MSMTLEEKWDSLREVAIRYDYLSRKAAGYHPLNSFSISTSGYKIKHWDYDKNELVVFEGCR